MVARVLEDHLVRIETNAVTLNARHPTVKGTFTLVPQRQEQQQSCACTLVFDVQSNIAIRPLDQRTMTVTLPAASAAVHDDTAMNDNENEEVQEASRANIAFEEQPVIIEDDTEEEEKLRVQVQTSICHQNIENATARLLKREDVSPAIQSYYVDIAATSDIGKLKRDCERFQTGIKNHNAQLTERFKDYKKKYDDLPYKTEFTEVKISASCKDALGCIPSLFSIDHPRAADIQTALSTAFGEDLNSVIFQSDGDLDEQMDGICCQSKCRVKSACLVEQDRLPEDVEEPRGALGRADSFIVLNKSREVETDRKLLSFAERFFRRLVVFEQSDDAIRYRTRSMLRGEMVVGLDRPNKVISWDGSQTLLDKQVSCARMGIVEYWRAKAYKELQRQRDELDSIDKELKVGLLTSCYLLVTSVPLAGDHQELPGA